MLKNNKIIFDYTFLSGGPRYLSHLRVCDKHRNVVCRPIYGTRPDKTCLRGFRHNEPQTSLLSYRDYLENWNFNCYKFTYGTFQKANNKGADQSVRMRKLFCTCVIRNTPKTGFLASRPIYLFDFWALSSPLNSPDLQWRDIFLQRIPTGQYFYILCCLFYLHSFLVAKLLSHVI